MKYESLPEQDIPQDLSEGEDPLRDEELYQQVFPVESSNESETVSGDLHAEILEAQQTGNEILAQIYALQVFLLAVIFAVIMYLIIKNNVTRHF